MGGVFLETRESFSEGEEILLTLSMAHYSKPFKITGEIVRSTPRGIGVKFKIVSQVQLSQVQQGLIQNLVKQVEKFKK
jgi:Tfp pilus assembly protein PilZ